ncbi:YpdA family putative bacillithiol disulfide reductase [Marinoscillum furvescens]|uniref:Thioredoxin reductase (NADPH) n=1 Tax=Marinoscillum furvescens DSM 4134 TaxID=1122208 RepID=A0A3D9L2C2_MARFU|nr:YpdA family putative bacillithiol disulfide reductase [Marinoscillum furvescens]RED98878.1 thioredoxin reductase (NADPH) [Marinoscillum furvescens DSM 4134]
MSDQKTDVLIIGAGPIGLACGIEAKRAGLSHVIIDKGCLVNSIYNYPANMTFFSTSDRLEIGGVPFISHNPKPTRPEALEYYRRVASSWELNTRLYESVDAVEKMGDLYQVTTSRGVFQARAIIIATGFYDLPYLLNVPGEDLPKVKHYYDDPHPYYDMRVAVVGAANSSVDVALETFRKGAKEVTMVIRESEINPRVKYWVRPDIENRIKEGSIKAYFESSITKITPRTIEVKTPDQELVLENDFVLAMTGYQPDFSFLESIGIAIGQDEFKTPTYNESTMETNVDNVYLAGVICGGLKTNAWFIENSRVHAEMIIDDLKKKSVVAE